MNLKVVRDKFTSSCVTSDACNVHSSMLALEMRQNSGLSIYLLWALVLVFFFFLLSKARCCLLCFSWHVSVCVCVWCVCSCMIISKAVGSKRAAQCRILAITNERRGKSKTYERKAEQRSDSLLWLVEICIVSSFSCQHFFELPQREEEEEGRAGCCSFIFPLLRVPVYLYTALFIFAVHLISGFFFSSRRDRQCRRESGRDVQYCSFS